MARFPKDNLLFLLVVALLSWLVPGGGYYFLNEKKRSIIIFSTVVLIFSVGLYVGSIGVIDPVRSWPWYIAQIMNSPMVMFIGFSTAGGGYRVYGWPNEIGQIYTSVAGLLNLLCIVNAVYLAYLRRTETAGG